MENIFLDFFETSVIISVIILGVALLSAIIDKKFTSKWKYWIWLIIAARLIIPFTPDLNINPGKLLVEVPNKVLSSPIIFEQPSEDLSTPVAGENYIPPQFEQQAPQMPETEGQITSTAENVIIYEHREEYIDETLSTEETSEPLFNITFLDVVLTVWLLGAVIIFAYNILAYQHFKRKMQTFPIPAESTERTVLEQVKLRLGIDKNIEMLFCRNITSPMVMGFIHPKVILPKENYGEEELYFILCHELTHYKRRDVLYKSVLLLANALHWFNPAVWLMRKLAGSDLEISCDSSVVGEGDLELRRRYSETILAAVHRENVACSAFMTHFYGGKKTLKKRFANIFNAGVRKKGTAAFIAVILVASFLATTVSCVPQTSEEPSGSSESESEQSETEQEQKNPVPPPSEETVRKAEEMFTAFNDGTMGNLENLVVVDNATMGIENIENFFAAAGGSVPASVMGYRYGSPLVYVFEISYTPENGVILYAFDDYNDEYNGYRITKIYDTKLFYYLTDNETFGFSVPKYSETERVVNENYEPETDIEGASLSAYDAGNEIRTIHELRSALAEERSLDWDYWNSLIPEDYFPEEEVGLYYGTAMGAAVINGEDYYKVAIYEYDSGKNTLPYDGTAYYINANDPHKIFFVNVDEGGLIPIGRIYDSAIVHDPVTAPYALGSKGEQHEIKVGDKIGEWTLESLERGYADWPMQDEIKAEFTGSVTLRGYLEPYAMGTWANYMFTVCDEDSERMPYYIYENYKSSSGGKSFMIENSDEIENFPEFSEGMIECEINVTKFDDRYGYTSGVSRVTINAVKPLSSVKTGGYRGEFKLGLEGDPVSVFVGENIGEWKLETYINNYSTNYYYGEFSADNVVLKGEIQGNNSPEKYSLRLDVSETERMPFQPMVETRGDHRFIHFDLNGGAPGVDAVLQDGIGIPVTIVVDNFVYYESDGKARDRAQVLAVYGENGEELYKSSVTEAFALGYNTANVKNIKKGDKLGDWTVEKFVAQYGESQFSDDGIDFVKVLFTGEVTLEGYFELSGYSDEVYDFIPEITNTNIKKLPIHFVNGESQNFRAVADIPYGIENAPELASGEKLHCEVTVSSYWYEYAHREIFPILKVTSITPLGEVPAEIENSFRLGKNGEVKDLSGDDRTIGDWTLWGFGAVPEREIVEAEFTGEVTLKGKIKTLSSDSESGYMYYFELAESDMDKIPYHVDYEGNYEEFYFDFRIDIPALKNIGDEGIDCEIVATRYAYSAEREMGCMNYLDISEFRIAGETFKQ